jgi:hypothetical protein
LFTIETLTPTIFFSVDREEYKKIESGLVSANQLAYQLSLMKEIPFFSDLEKNQLETLATKVIVRYFEPNSHIVTENTTSTKVYLMCSGKVSLKKTVKLVHNSSKDKFYVWNDSTGLKKGQEISEKSVSFAMKEKGSFFPEFVDVDALGATSSHNLRQKLLSFISYNAPRGFLKAFSTSEAIAPTVVIELKKLVRVIDD